MQCVSLFFFIRKRRIHGFFFFFVSSYIYLSIYIYVCLPVYILNNLQFELNKLVQGTDFEFVRLVKIMETLVAGLSIKIHFEAKSCAAAADYTLKTFEGFVFMAIVYRHRVWPLSCQLLCPNPVYDERISLSHEH